MANSSFSPHGVVIPTSNGNMVLNAGANMTILPNGNLVTFSAQIPNAVVNNSGVWQPPQMSDAKAPNGTIYYSTTASKLVFKDYSDVVHNLY